MANGGRTGEAVVLGGSIAGMLAARALAPHHERVTVVERDHFPAVGRRRTGVPQDRHVHSLHPRGRDAMERLLPGLTDELVERGAVLGELGIDTRIVFGRRPLARTSTGHTVVASSRPLLEGQIRTRVLALDNVEARESCDALGVVVREGRVTGVRVLGRRDGDAEEVLAADVVVDATGRQTRLPRWLEELGLTPPEEEVSSLDVAYVSGRFARRPDDEAVVNVVASVPPHGRSAGAALAAEGDSIVVTLSGLLGQVPPTDPDELVRYAAGLQDPVIHDLIAGREPLSEPVLMRIPPGRRRYYDRLEDLPAGLVPIGDALCSFNPVYGQGMSVAAVSAARLADCLADGHERLTARYLAAVGGILEHAWSMARGADARFLPSVRDRQPLPVRLVGRYQQHLVAAAADDPVVAAAFLETIGLVAPPQSLLRPRVVLRVLAHALRAGRRATRAGRADVPAEQPARG